ncbi:glycosyltransferase family 4 protein [Flavimarina sp. Hel_I_48]|uniref:glycosyltransferase family 4 protein n=1 Tax=Flavimarina sp. Hel_I_48 TaxID=1392488 RepID=UPI0004DF226B|nr:glycosyltransferase family 4 protein [Flavimarina sp. Hel_I_48]
MKKVLIISYYWPPAGGPGVQRWLKFATYLPDFGIKPVVYIPENPTYPILDESLLADVPEKLEILKNSIIEPYTWANIISKKNTETISSGIISEEKRQTLVQKFMLYIRGNFFVPDARKFWIKPSVDFLETYLSENKVDAIITTGPPHSLHLIGLELKQKTGLTWIADFRDPWTTIGYHDKLKLTKAVQLEHKQLEKRVLENCDQVITTSPTTKKDFEQIADTPVTCITNGYDQEGDLDIDHDRAFSLAHIGSLLEKRNPLLLWKVLGDLKKANMNFGNVLKIKLAGSVSEDVVRSIRDHHLGENLEILGYVGHKDALKLQRESQILLLIEVDSEETKAIIPGKVFEYLAARRPILAIGPENADFFEIIKETSSGECFNYNDEEALKSQILKWYQIYNKTGLLDNDTDISAYSRKNLTGQLAHLIDKVLEA